MKKIIVLCICVFLFGCESYVEKPNKSTVSGNLTDYLNLHLTDEEKTMLHQLGAARNSDTGNNGSRADNITPTLLVKMIRMEKRQEEMEKQLIEMHRILAGERFQAMAKEDTIALIRVFMENNPDKFTDNIEKTRKKKGKK